MGDNFQKQATKIVLEKLTKANTFQKLSITKRIFNSCFYFIYSLILLHIYSFMQVLLLFHLFSEKWMKQLRLLFRFLVASWKKSSLSLDVYPLPTTGMMR